MSKTKPVAKNEGQRLRALCESAIKDAELDMKAAEPTRDKREARLAHERLQAMGRILPQ